jgi:hypothetical protein
MQAPKFTEEAKQQTPEPVEQSPSATEPKTVVRVMTEFSQDLKDKVALIDERLRALSQLGVKLRHSVKTLQDKSTQMRSDGNESSQESTYHVASNAERASPLDQLQDAFYALKQQGVRLYLAILDNHSSKQLAIETEQLNLLVERVEATVSKMRSTLAAALDQVTDAQSAAPNVSLEIVELINMDANQAVRDLDLWQSEFDDLGKAVLDLKREVSA